MGARYVCHQGADRSARRLVVSPHGRQGHEYDYPCGSVRHRQRSLWFWATLCMRSACEVDGQQHKRAAAAVVLGVPMNIVQGIAGIIVGGAASGAQSRKRGDGREDSRMING